MANLKKHLVYSTIFFILICLQVQAIDCQVCGAIEQPSLAMVCAECGANLHKNSKVKRRSNTVLVVEMLYTGNDPNGIPDYGKLFINRKYRGNVRVKERETRDPLLFDPNREDLGHEYTAAYRHEIRNLDPGLYDVRLEMQFRRVSGLWKSIRRVEYIRVGLKQGEKTVIKHYFSGARDFSKPNKKKIPKAGIGPDIHPATGAVVLEMPVF